MLESNDDIARRVLASVLDRLEATSGSRSTQSASGVEYSVRAFSDNDPIVVVVLGSAAMTAADSQLISKEAPPNSAPNGSQPVAGSASHPGLERFDMPVRRPTPGALKTCFMEPDRPCVNSGACEMRGY